LQAPSTTSAAARQIPKGATCGDCYFEQQGLCALALAHPCPTFRAAGDKLEPPYQARLIPRTVGVAVAAA
jgi:hypothetical protein